MESVSRGEKHLKREKRKDYNEKDRKMRMEGTHAVITLITMVL